MRRVIRMMSVAGLALALAGVPSGSLAQDEDVMKTPPPKVSEVGPKAEGTCHVSDPCEDVNLGAPGMEPEPDQKVEEDPGTKAHREWVESIWTTL